MSDCLCSDDESDEDAPREKVPQWATSPQIRAALSKVHVLSSYYDVCAESILVIEMDSIHQFAFPDDHTA